MEEVKIPARSISMLIQIKQYMISDNQLCTKITGCGKWAVANYIDRLVSALMKLETYFDTYKGYYNIEKEENAEYSELLCGLRPDQLTAEETEQIQALARTFIKEDEEE